MTAENVFGKNPSQTFLESASSEQNGCREHGDLGNELGRCYKNCPISAPGPASPGPTTATKLQVVL